MLLVSAIVGLISLHLLFAWSNGSVGQMADEAIYMLMADSIAGHVGYSGSAQASDFIWPYTHFPPLYPLLLGVLGADANHIGWAHLLTAGTTGAGAWVMYVWGKNNVKLPRSIVLSTTIVWMLLPQSLLASVSLLTEPLYVLLSVVAIDNLNRIKDGQAVTILLVLLIVAATLTRLVGGSIALTFVAMLAVKRTKGATLWVGAVALPVFLWIFVSFHYLAGARWYVEDTAIQYSGMNLVGVLKHLFIEMPLVLVNGWGAQFDVTGLRTTAVFASAVLACVVAGLLQRMSAGYPDAWYVAVYLIVIWLWPYPDHAARFLWTVSPFLLLYGIEFVANALRECSVDLRLGWLGMLLLVAATTPSWVFFLQRYVSELPGDLEYQRGSRLMLLYNHDEHRYIEYGRNFDAIIKAMQASREVIPPGECAFCMYEEPMMFFSRRGSYPPPRPQTSEYEFNRQMEGCKYVLVLFINGHPTFPGGYPLERLKGRGRLLWEYRPVLAGADTTIAQLILLN